MSSTESRRAKSDTTAAAVAAFTKANQVHPWPVAVSRLPKPEDAGRAESIFGGILAARDPTDWRPNDLVLAGQLANCMAQSDRVTAEIEATGWTIPSPKNPLQSIRNPLLDALTLISSRQLSLTRALALNGPPADRKTLSHRARAVGDARAVMGRGGLLAGVNDSELFASPDDSDSLI